MIPSLSAIQAAEFKKSDRVLSLKSSGSLKVEPPNLSPITLYGAVGDVVKKLEPHTEAHPAALLLQYLVALGNVLGRGAYCIAESDKHYPNLFAAIVGDSSLGKKGTSWGRVMSLMKEIDPDWSKGNIVSGLGSGEDASNGFSNRFLWGFSSRTKLLPDGGNIHPEEFYEEICLLTKNIGVIHDAGSFQVHRNEEASRYWHEIYPELTSARVGRWGSSTSRGAPQVVRISLIFCLLDGKKTIELPHLKAAKALWDYCCDSARWAFEDFQFSPNATKLIAALSHGDMTIADVSQLVFKRNLSKMEINDIIDEIESVLVPPKLPTMEDIQHKEKEREKDRQLLDALNRL